MRPSLTGCRALARRSADGAQAQLAAALATNAESTSNHVQPPSRYTQPASCPWMRLRAGNDRIRGGRSAEKPQFVPAVVGDIQPDRDQDRAAEPVDVGQNRRIRSITTPLASATATASTPTTSAIPVA